MSEKTASVANDNAGDTEHKPLIGARQAPAIVQLSASLRKLVDFCGRWASLFIIPLILITVWDVTVRKIPGLQYWLVQNAGGIFGSTLLQELEWHFHTALFALVLGYGYIYNTHVRVDLIRENLRFRKKAWLELFGCTFFMIPFCCVVIWFAFDYAYQSFVINEISASTVGLTHRWIIKSVLVLGLLVTLIAGISVWLQTVLVLFGPRDLRFDLMTLEWPEEEGTMIEGKKRLEFDEEEAEKRLLGPAAPSPAPGD